jgi:ABC-type multidrug transport system fused ATPase/permease subunit
MLDQIKEQNKCIRELLFTVLETLSGVLVAGALILIFFGTWITTGGFIVGFISAVVTVAIAFVAFAFTFGILFMMMDIKENSERTAVAMEKLAGMTAAAQKTETKPTAAPAVKKAAPAKKATAKKAPAKKPAAKKPAAKKAPAKKK